MPDWPGVPLSEAVEFLDAQRRPVKAADRAAMRGRIPYYGASGVVDHVNGFLFDEDLILLGEDGENILSRVVPLAFKITGKSWVNNHAHVLRPRAGFDVDYLGEYLESLDYRHLNTGTAQPKLNKHSCKTIIVLKPPLVVQQAIAKALDDASALIRATELLIAKKRAIRDGLADGLLLGKRRLTSFAEPWQRRSLGDLLRYAHPTPYLVSNTDYVRSGTPVLTAGKTFLLGYTSDRDGIYSEVPVIIFDDFTTESKLVLFPFKAKSSAMKMLSAKSGVNLTFIYDRMQLINYHVADHKRRWISEYSKREVGVPSLEEQREIVIVLDDAEREIEVLRSRLAKVKAIKRGMMQELLAGTKRLELEAVA
jgi:type I restriction enzyme S subunit